MLIFPARHLYRLLLLYVVPVTTKTTMEQLILYQHLHPLIRNQPKQSSASCARPSPHQLPRPAVLQIGRQRSVGVAADQTSICSTHKTHAIVALPGAGGLAARAQQLLPHEVLPGERQRLTLKGGRDHAAGLRGPGD